MFDQLDDYLIECEPDVEYTTRLDAERVSVQWRDAIRPACPQNAIEDLPLFGGERQGEMF